MVTLFEGDSHRIDTHLKQPRLLRRLVPFRELRVRLLTADLRPERVWFRSLVHDFDFRRRQADGGRHDGTRDDLGARSLIPRATASVPSKHPGLTVQTRNLPAVQREYEAIARVERGCIGGDCTQNENTRVSLIARTEIQIEMRRCKNITHLAPLAC